MAETVVKVESNLKPLPGMVWNRNFAKESKVNVLKVVIKSRTYDGGMWLITKQPRDEELNWITM